MSLKEKNLNRKSWWTRTLTIAAVSFGLGFFALPPVQAQVETSADVARVSLIRGDVSMQRGDTGDWSVATLNTPLVTGDSIATGDASRAEVQLNYASLLRLDDHSQAQLATLSRDRIQVQVAQGLVNYTILRGGSEAAAEIDTPNVAVHPLREGVYRIEVDSGDQTRVIVREGEAEISTPQGSTQIRKGQLITVRGTGADVEYQTADAPSNDDWDRWNRNRDNVILNAKAWRYTNRYYTGADDLDAYGTWRDVPGCGHVWVPTVAVGWAPYRLGRWVWEPYYGWTWVSYEPWGWAPYHYGRWFIYAGSWVWWPGPVYAAYRPIWAPAYVSFFGFGGGVSIGVGFGGGFGSIGWLPVGPGDYYHPWYGAYRNRFTVINVTNINIYNRREGRGFRPLLHGDRYSNFRGMLTNNRLREGISNVPSNRFGRGGYHERPVSFSELRRARVMTGNLPVVPTRDSLRASDRAVRFRPSASAGRERFFMKSQPAARPEPFSRQASRVRQAIERSGGSGGREAQPNAVTPRRAPGAQPGARIPERGAAPPVRNENRRAQPSERANRPQANQPRPPASQSRPRANSPQSPARDQAQPRPNWRRFSERPSGPANQARPGDNRTQPRTNQMRPPAQDRNRGQSPATQSQPRANPPQTRVRDQAQPQGNWRRFSGRQSGPAGQVRPSQDRSQPPARSSQPPVQDRNRGQSSSGESRPPARNEARPQSRSQRAPARSGAPANRAQPSDNRGRSQADRPQGRAQSSGQGGWQRFTRSARSGPAPRDATAADRRGNNRPADSSYRRPLNLNKPIVQRRSSGHRFDGTYGGRGGNVGRDGGFGGYRPAPNYRSQPSGNGHRAPSYRSRPNVGQRSAPSNRRAPSTRSRGGASHRSGSHRR